MTNTTCIIQSSYDAFHNPSPSLLALPYSIFASSTLILLFGAPFILYTSSISVTILFYFLTIDVFINLLYTSVQTECTSLTFFMAILSAIVFRSGFALTRYARRRILIGVAGAIACFHLLLPIPLPRFVTGLPLVANMSIVIGWSSIFVVFLMGITWGRHFTRATRVFCAAQGAHGIVVTLPILLDSSFSISIEPWQRSVLYFSLFTVSFFIQYIPSRRVLSGDIEYGINI